jgi:acetyl-CoA acetyltransferase
MTQVSIAGVHTLKPDNYWSASLGELALEAAAPLVPKEGVDTLICVAPSACLVQGQADFAAIVADRLCISPTSVLTLEASDASAASALQVAWQLCAYSGGSALIVAAAKVSDLSEAERLALLDRSLDQEAELESGVTFAGQAGLLAARYCRMHGGDLETFAAITAANHTAWARHLGLSALSAAEIRRDLVVAPPLVRSDFAQLLDGAGAALLVADPRPEKWSIHAVGSGVDTVALWERSDPLAFVAVERAAAAAIASSPAPQWLELDVSSSVIQRLSEDAVLRVTKAKPDLVNVRGGAQGRGRVWGGSVIYQLQDIFECGAPFSTSLIVSTAGLGSRAFAAQLVRRMPS